MRVSDTRQMIDGMDPVLMPGTWAFVTDPRPDLPTLATIVEDEGLSAIVPVQDGPDGALPMRRITLRVHSALDGVGLTAAVSGALADVGIACNMVAGHHHDHAFVPEADAERALGILRALSGRTT